MGKETYLDRFRRLEPVASLSEEQIDELVDQVSIERHNAGAQLFRSGDSDGQLVYILSGSVELTAANQENKKMVKGGSGDALYPIDDKSPHQCQAVTITPSVIARVDRDKLDTLLTWGQISVPETEVMMSEDGIVMINKADWLKIMMKSPTFRSLPPSNISELLQLLEPVRVHAGDVIIRQGDQGDYFYMINEGSALVTRNPDNDEDSVEMAELPEGSTFGEAALISDSPRNATVSMMSDGMLLRLSKEDFNKLLRQPTLHEVTYKQAMSRINNQDACWIDVRLPSEFEHGHLPGAVNIPIRDIHRLAGELNPAKSYICYCETGKRSSAASFTLMQYGLDAFSLKGGMQNTPSDHITH